MARQVVYEGSDLQQLLQQVVDEHGPARIHPPERRRKGGVLGFFAREVYVITVDVDTPASGAQVNGVVGSGGPGATSGAPGVALPRKESETAVRRRQGGAIVETPLSALVESTEDEAVLGTVSGAAPGSATPNGATPGAGTPNGATPGSATPPVGDKPFGEVLSEVASSLGEEPGTYRPDPERLRPRRPSQAEPLDLAPYAGADPIAVQLPLIGVEEEAPPELGATIVDLLRAAGLPERLLPMAALSTDRSTVEAVFGALPEPPPLPAEPGGLVAVVGPAGLVRAVANAAALSVGCPRDEVAVASPGASDRQARPELRARTAAQAASMSPGWRRDRVGVVAVYAPPLGTDQRWTRQILRALRPSCVWGMAVATTKPDDVRRWIGAIGGVDALVLTEVASTATPAAILSVGVPVARLDDDPATPARWAAVVADLVTKH